MRHKPLPRALIVVATLFIIAGATRLRTGTLTDANTEASSFSVFLDVARIAIGIGLLCLSSLCRRAAIGFLAMNLIGFGLAGFFGLWVMDAGPVQEMLYASMILAVLGLVYWAVRVLQRPEVVDLFESEICEPIGTSPAQRYVDWYAQHGRKSPRSALDSWEP